jgi:GMP synthase-like glutamine amidotransferase
MATRCDAGALFRILHACRAHLTSFRTCQVLELPPGAELLAQSGTAANEIWTFQDRALAIQGHPEMPVSEAQTKILPFLADNGWVAVGLRPVSWKLV